MERWLITGSKGFLGSNLVRSLSDQEVRCLKREEYKRPSQALTEFKPDYIVNYASYGNMYGQVDTNEILVANVNNFLKLLRDAKGYKGFIAVSSLSVKLPVQTDYSRAKMVVESFVDTRDDLPIVCVRPASITGTGEQKEHLIPTLIRSCLYGEPMKFTPNPMHDFLDIEDFTEAVRLLAHNADKYKGQIFEIGSGKMYSNLEVLRLVEEITRQQANITDIVESMREYDTKEWVADTTKIESLGWKPKKTLKKSIEEMVNVKS